MILMQVSKRIFKADAELLSWDFSQCKIFFLKNGSLIITFINSWTELRSSNAC